MPTIGITELVIILIVALLIFGPKAIPQIGKAIGQGLSEFKKASHPDSGDSPAAGEDKKEE